MLIEVILAMVMVFCASIPWIVIAAHIFAMRQHTHSRSFLLFLWVVLDIFLAYSAYLYFAVLFQDTFQNYSTHLIGGLILLIGLYVGWRARRDLGTARLMGSSEFKRTKEPLVSYGLYKRARHPRHVAYLLWVLGLGMLFGYYSVILFAFYLFGAFAIATYVEEKELITRYGKKYIQYRKNTGPFFISLPFPVWYLLLLITHFAHILEEYFFGAPFIAAYGNTIYAFLEITFFVGSIIIAHYALRRNTVGLTLARIYATVMIVDGLFHLLTWFTYKNYIGGGAGSLTAIVLIYLASTLLCETPVIPANNRAR